MNTETLFQKIKRIVWSPMDPWLFYAMLAIYIMSLFLLYSADGQQIGQLENKTLHTVLGFMLLWLIARTRPQILSNFALPMYAIGVPLPLVSYGGTATLSIMVVLALLMGIANQRR